MKFGISTYLCAGLIIASSTTLADVLLIDTIHQAPLNSSEGIPRPTRGMTMDQVKRDYGDPSMTHPWIGDPPITRWDYADYSVFFEYRHVLTSVVHPR
ncbi:MAG: hypothetical protein QNJ78_05680 [Gammaproteobacteria bacterium]|nr:hypothetical protein [Gammaproteobacteria bacterium]